MRHLEPHRQHPLYWLLTEVFGVPEAELKRRSGASKSTLRRLALGYDVDPQLLEKLRSLVPRIAAEIAAADLELDQYTAPGGERHVRDTDPQIVEWRRHTYTMANYLAELYRPVPKEPRTVLEDLVAANIGTAGAPRSEVVARVKSRRHSAYAIRRAAERIGVREIDRRGVKYWLPAPNRVAPRPPPPQYGTPSGPRSRRLYDRITIMLGRAPDCTLPAATVVDTLRAEGFSRVLIFRAATDLRLVRETTGFGPTKRTLWMLPHSSTDDGDDHHDVAPKGKLVSVDFSRSRLTPDDSE